MSAMGLTGRHRRRVWRRRFLASSSWARCGAGTIQDSWDHNSGARNANLEMINRLILLGTAIADLTNSRNAMTVSDLSGANRSTRYEHPDTRTIRPIAGFCDASAGADWDAEANACVQKHRSRSRSCKLETRMMESDHETFLDSSDRLRHVGRRRRPTFRSSTRPTMPSPGETAETTAKILDTNKEILTTVEETLKAVTGDRGSDAGLSEGSRSRQRVQRLVGAFLRQLLQGWRRRFRVMIAKVAQAATLFINGLQLVRSLSGKENSSLASDKSYEELIRRCLASPH